MSRTMHAHDKQQRIGVQIMPEHRTDTISPLTLACALRRARRRFLAQRALELVREGTTYNEAIRTALREWGA